MHASLQLQPAATRWVLGTGLWLLVICSWDIIKVYMESDFDFYHRAPDFRPFFRSPALLSGRQGIWARRAFNSTLPICIQREWVRDRQLWLEARVGAAVGRR